MANFVSNYRNFFIAERTDWIELNMLAEEKSMPLGTAAEFWYRSW